MKLLFYMTKLKSQDENLTVRSCHATYTFQGESILYSCLNVKNSLLEAGAKSEV